MSQHRITLPITVNDLSATSVFTRPVSLADSLANPDTAQVRFVYPELGKGHLAGPFDPWQLRDEFLNWPLEDWEAFFYMAGTFGGLRIARKDFAEWQELMRKALLLPAREWKSLAGEFDSKKVSKLTGSLHVQFDWNTEPPTATVASLTSLISMIATIQLDKLQGVQFRLCARHDCKNPPFPVGSRQKIYCSPDCAHLVAVRNSRERAAQTKGVRKPTQRGKKLHR